MSEHGKLYLIPTPVGNLEDITLRAIRLLKECDLILAEDTRVTIHLLKHYQIENKLSSFHSFNEHKALERIVNELAEGKNIALVSDAGTPGISDPGFLLVRSCVQQGIAVECLPGATALIPALVMSGFPTDSFVFEGFPPVKKGRKTWFETIAKEERTVVFYESPHRLLKTLEELIASGQENRKISVAREISKKFEEIVRGTPAEVFQHFNTNVLKGEFVIVLDRTITEKKRNRDED
ncbi:MAG TPA: 16S rRNA (cytidine(1402)-2'-O)-methyltransferase [Cytophagaceae bacterium]|jgi:16S rRNA (cytidine1402-2'-O)-methyltransferase|nr:16S rRNA (cytidine(1402)-2'-O)-methyltransferase [Cytophagaceae bacterium]